MSDPDKKLSRHSQIASPERERRASRTPRSQPKQRGPVPVNYSADASRAELETEERLGSRGFNNQSSSRCHLALALRKRTPEEDAILLVFLKFDGSNKWNLEMGLCYLP